MHMHGFNNQDDNEIRYYEDHNSIGKYKVRKQRIQNFKCKNLFKSTLFFLFW